MIGTLEILKLKIECINDEAHKVYLISKCTALYNLACFIIIRNMLVHIYIAVGYEKKKKRKKKKKKEEKMELLQSYTILSCVCRIKVCAS